MLATLADKIILGMPPKLLSRVYRTIPRPLLFWKRDESFRHIVRYVYKKSKFYRRRFDEFKISPSKVRKPSDLGEFYTTPQDIIDHAEEFLCRTPHMVFESSGTTGRNKRIYMTQDELDDVGKLNATGFYLWGLNENDRLVNAFDFCIWIPGIITHKGLEKARMFGLAAGKIDPMEVYKRIPQYKFNVIMGEPTWLIKLTEIAEKHGAYPLKLIVGGAEGMPDAARPWMEKVWPGVKVLMSYTGVEAGGVMACELSSGCDGYHIDENDFMVEIINPDADGYGEVAFTTLDRRTMPLIRYRNRDVTKIIEERCAACGVPHRRLAKLRGRADEIVVSAGGNVYPLMFENILKDVEGITSDWHVVIKLRGMKEIMEFNLELQEGHIKENIQERIFENIRSRYPDIWKNFSIAIFEMEFTYHSPGSLRAGARKLLRLSDKRYAK